MCSVSISQSINVMETLKQRKTHFIAVNSFKIALFQSNALSPAFGNMADNDFSICLDFRLQTF